MLGFVSLALATIGGIVLGRGSGAALARRTNRRVLPFAGALAGWCGLIYVGAVSTDAGIEAGVLLAWTAMFALGGTIVGWSRLNPSHRP